jgi:hypothetical protein
MHDKQRIINRETKEEKKTERKKQGKQHVLCRPNLHPRVVEIGYSGYMRRDLERLGTCVTWLWRHTAWSSYLFLQYDMLPLPILHHPQCLKSAYNVVRVDGHLLTDVCKTKILHLSKSECSVQEWSNVFPLHNISASFKMMGTMNFKFAKWSTEDRKTIHLGGRATVQIDAGSTLRKPGFNALWLHTRFVVGEVVMEQVLLRGFLGGVGWGFLLITISLLVHIYITPPLAICDSPDQLAHYHNFVI